jgi:hypothetical protein
MKRNLYFLALFVGFIASVYVASTYQIPIARMAWFFWSSSLLFLPIFALFTVAEYFLSYWPSIKNSSGALQSSKSFIGSPPKFIVMTFLAFLMSGIFHVVIGLFLSIILPVEPLQIFAIEGYNKNFGLELILYHLQNFPVLLPPFLLLKSSLLFIEPGVRLRGHSVIRDGIVPLLAGFVCSMNFKNELPLTAIILFSALIFLPWTVLFGKDRFDKVATREPEFQIPIQIPVEHTYRPNVSPFWGILLLCLSVFILGLCFASAAKVFQSNPGSLIGSALIGLIGILVASGFLFAGVNMLFAFRKVILTSHQAEVFEKAYLIFIPKIKNWKSSMADFTKVQAAKKVFAANSDTNAYYFVVQLMNEKDPKKNIELYRANHSDEYLNIAEQWRKLLNLQN